jgi:hypothetical protein
MSIQKSSTHLKIFLLSLNLLFLSLQLEVQDLKAANIITGSINDEQGNKVSYATVSLIKAKDSTLVKGALSSDAGAFLFRNVKPGNYFIKISSVGYRLTMSSPFDVLSGQEKIRYQLYVSHFHWIWLVWTITTYQIYEVVACVLLFQIVFSAIWLKYFLFGPFEWVWRSLTY